MKTIYSAVFLLLILSNSFFAQTNNPFEGFKFMNLPINRLPIGALWNTSLGPMDGGVNEEKIIKSSSYSNLNMIISKDLKTSVDVGIQNFLSLNGGYSSLSGVSISVKKLEKLTLNSIELLKSNVGNQILYEGLRASEFSIIVNKNKAADAQVDLLKIFKNLDLKVDVNTDNTATITATGVDLFIAYRVVKIESENQKSKKLKFRTQGYSGEQMIKLSSTYEAVTSDFVVVVCPCHIMNCMAKSKINDNMTYASSFPKCASSEGYDLTVILKNDMDMTTGKPKEYRYVIKNNGGSIYNYNQPIYNKPTSKGLEVSYLNFERLVFETVGESGMLYMLLDNKYRNVSLVKVSYQFKNVVPTTVAGY